MPFIQADEVLAYLTSLSTECHACYATGHAGMKERGLTLGAPVAKEGDLVVGGWGGGNPVALAELAQAVGPVGGKAVGHHIGVGDLRKLQCSAHLGLAAKQRWGSCLACMFTYSGFKHSLKV